MALFDVEERDLTVAGSPMPYASFGHGDRPLVMIPGLSLRSVRGAGLPLALQYRLFTRDFRVYVLDKRDDLPEPCTISALAEDVADAMHLLGIGHADIVGISQGGMIAQHLALDHPELVDKLVLGVTLSRTNDAVREAVDFWTDAAEHGDWNAIVQDMMGRMYSERYAKRYGWLFPLLLKTVKLSDPARFVKLARSCLTCESYGRLDHIACPTLVLGASEDRIVTAEASREIAERIGCPLHIYEGFGHSAYEEAPDFNRRIYDFLMQP